MKIIQVFFVALIFALASSGRAAQSARARLFCWSLHFHQGTNSFDGTLDLTGEGNVPNGELLWWYVTFTHRSGFVLNRTGLPITGTLYLNLPFDSDANSDGFDDSYEVSQAVEGASTGQYSTAQGSGSITATWSRAAGSKDGTCSLHLVDDQLGDLGTFQHSFEVLEFSGTLTYTPGATNVNGSVNLTNASGQLKGAVSFVKSATNPHDELTLAAGGWTNGAMQALPFASDTFNRDHHWPTNYFGVITFADGDLTTANADYRSWELLFDDLNDTDHDGIPDFSDELASALPRRPVLTLTRGTNSLLLKISGDVGHVHYILESTNLVAGNWATNLSLTLTTDPQTVSLAIPPDRVKFWRVRAQ